MRLRLQQLNPTTKCLSNRPKDLQMSFLSVGPLHMNNWDQLAAIHSSTYLKSAPVKWDSSNIMLLSGNVESNPGLHYPIGNPMYCIICSAKIKRSIQQKTALSCTKTDCRSQCHQGCNGLTVAHTRHAKSCGHHIPWKCP